MNLEARRDITYRAADAAGAAAQPWSAIALAAVEYVAWSRAPGSRITTDEVWAEMDRRGIERPAEPRALGAVMRTAAKRGYIKVTDEFTTMRRETTSVGTVAHASPLRVYTTRGYPVREFAALWPPPATLAVIEHVGEVRAKANTEEAIANGTWRCKICGTEAPTSPRPGLDPTMAIA